MVLFCPFSQFNINLIIELSFIDDKIYLLCMIKIIAEVFKKYIH